MFCPSSNTVVDRVNNEFLEASKELVTDSFYIAYEDSTNVRLSLVDQASNVTVKNPVSGESNLGLVTIDRVRGTVAKAVCTTVSCEVRYDNDVAKTFGLNEAVDESPFALAIVERTAEVGWFLWYYGPHVFCPFLIMSRFF